MEIEKLKSFIEVYNCRNISKAAENLYISQSALSRRIQSLEAELQTELFVREGSAIKPTSSAEVLYIESSKILRQHDETILKINKVKTGSGGILHIGVLDVMSIAPTLRAVSKMQKLYPDLEMTFDCDKYTNVAYQLIRGKIDVGVTILGEVSGLESLKYEILGKNTLAVLVGRDHRLWGIRPLYVENLDGERLYYIAGEANQSLASVNQYLHSRKIKIAEHIPCRSIQELLMYVSTGKGLATSGVISNELFGMLKETVDLVPLEDTELKQGYSVVIYNEENPMSIKFAEMLEQSW